MDSAILEVKNFFRASMGDYKITIIIKKSDRVDKITFPSQNYYRNQILYFNKCNAEISKEYMKQSEERAYLLEQIIRKMK